MVVAERTRQVAEAHGRQLDEPIEELRSHQRASEGEQEDLHAIAPEQVVSRLSTITRWSNGGRWMQKMP